MAGHHATVADDDLAPRDGAQADAEDVAPIGPTEMLVLAERLKALTLETSDLLTAMRQAGAAGLPVPEPAVSDEREALIQMHAMLAEVRALVARIDAVTVYQPIYLRNASLAVTRLGGWDGHPIAVPTSDAGVLISHSQGGANGEPGVRAVIRRLLRPGDIAYDIGANVGVHSVIMGYHVGRTGHLVCVEPQAELADALKVTMLLNGFSGFSTVVAAAVGERLGTAAFHRAAHSPESSLFADIARSIAPAESVEITTLDTLAAAHAGRADLIKIDAEGSEAAIWRGMEGTINANPDLKVIAEIAPTHFARSSESLSSFLERVKFDGFTMAIIDEPTGALVPCDAEALGAAGTNNVLLTRAPRKRAKRAPKGRAAAKPLKATRSASRPAE
jgi:FkbM family methyltransferase